MRCRRALAIVAAAICTPLGVAAASASSASTPTVSARPAGLGNAQAALVRLRVPDRAFVESLVAQGADLTGARPLSGGAYQLDGVFTGTQLDALGARGARLLQTIERPGDGTARYLASVAAAARMDSSGLKTNTDTLHFLQAYWWRSRGQTFVGVEVATTATQDPDVEIDVAWRTADGTHGSFPLHRFVDDGEYQYHYALPQPVPGAPLMLTATSSRGGTTTVTPQKWTGVTPPKTPAGYQKDFIQAYMTPEDVRARIQRLADQYPNLVDVINLPNPTQGYRRDAAAYLGDPDSAAAFVESTHFGSQGWNGVQVKAVDPKTANSPLTATYTDRVLSVSLATGPDGALKSTVAQVASYITSNFPTLFRSYPRPGQGTEIMPASPPRRMTDGLKADSSVPRAPWTVQALRIGVHRDGSRIGVLAYSEEHAREWATPLVTLEFAERLLANYGSNPEDTKLLRNVEVFVVPVTNPDGANYSFNDYNFQRKNMHDWCKGSNRDPAYRDYWGVDVNRNYAVGSIFDGYVGASHSCFSEVSAGTHELSEPESSNIIALAAAHPNIKFAMNVHSYGGYFMWPPGAYKAQGRITLPRPSIEESAQFLDAAKHIVAAIASERGTVTWPAQTGPVADVLYSAAGNSADQLYYQDGIYAWDFETGNDKWNKAAQEWEGVGFQPPFSEAHGEAMEYASGLVELVRVAYQYEQSH
jgi:hypothetical protein